MSDESPTPEPSASAAQTNKGPLIIAVTVAAVAGSAAGMAVIGPMLATPASAASAASAAEASGEGEHGDGGADSAAGSGAPVVLNNIVMNPAASRGTRFLLVSVGFDFSPAVSSEAFGNRETEIRDVVIGVLSAKTVDELVDYTRRDGFRTEIAAAMEKLLPGTKVRRVFFPQFVIQ